MVNEKKQKTVQRTFVGKDDAGDDKVGEICMGNEASYYYYIAKVSS
jgi:hypothetical protein